MLRIGLLTSGGDCQALNATMRGIVKTILNNSKDKVEIYGFEDGYQGLIYGRYREMNWGDFSGVLTQGGTILGTSRTPFKLLDEPGADGVKKVPAMVETYRKLKLDCLFMLGGNGSTKTANRLREEGLNIIALPKTIDNDTYGTDMTFGFTSAIDVATRCIDDIHTTASSHGRVFVIEIMGHKVGWIPLYSGVAGGADVILIPEIPYDMDNVVKAIERREKKGGRFAIVVVAEGAISREEAAMKKKDYKAKVEGEKAAAEKRSLYRKLLEPAGVDPKRIETVLKVSDLENVTVKDGAIEGADKLTEGIKADWADFIATTTVKGADVAHAPKGEGGKDINEMSTAEYMKYKAEQRG